MATFKKIIINKKWWGTYDVVDSGKSTGITIHQSENGIGDEFYCMVAAGTKYYFDFEPCVRKSLETAKSYVNRFLEKR